MTRTGIELTGRGKLQELANVESALIERHALIQADKADQKNEAAEREIDRDFPRGKLPISKTPNADQKEGGNKRELVEGVEEEKVERSKCSHRTSSDK